MTRSYDEIDIEIAGMRKAIQRMMHFLEELTDERQRKREMEDFLKDRDQKCAKCGGELEKRRQYKTRHPWKCRKCTQKEKGGSYTKGKLNS